MSQSTCAGSRRPPRGVDRRDRPRGVDATAPAASTRPAPAASSRPPRRGRPTQDFKIENLVVTVDAEGNIVRVRLTDLGLAQEFAPGARASELKGAPGFYAPEMTTARTAPRRPARESSPNFAEL